MHSFDIVIVQFVYQLHHENSVLKSLLLSDTFRSTQFINNVAVLHRKNPCVGLTGICSSFVDCIFSVQHFTRSLPISCLCVTYCEISENN